MNARLAPAYAFASSYRALSCLLTGAYSLVVYEWRSRKSRNPQWRHSQGPPGDPGVNIQQAPSDCLVRCAEPTLELIVRTRCVVPTLKRPAMRTLRLQAAGRHLDVDHTFSGQSRQGR